MGEFKALRKSSHLSISPSAQTPLGRKGVGVGAAVNRQYQTASSCSIPVTEHAPAATPSNKFRDASLFLFVTLEGRCGAAVIRDQPVRLRAPSEARLLFAYPVKPNHWTG